ncbi:hypothetical protein [Streptomyces sp. NPDC004286]
MIAFLSPSPKLMEEAVRRYSLREDWFEVLKDLKLQQQVPGRRRR